MRCPSLSGGGLPTTLGENAEKRNGFATGMAETRFSDPASAAVVTTQESVKSESRHKLYVHHRNEDGSSLAATTHDLPLGGIVG